MRLLSNRGQSMPAPTSTSVPPRMSWESPACMAAAWPEHSSTASNGSSTRSNGIGGLPSSSGATTTAPSCSASACRVGCGSLATTSVTPRARAAAIVSAPIGPHPVTRMRCPARTPPRVRPWSATASGSASAAARIDTPGGTRRSSGSRTRTKSANAPWNPPTPGLLRPTHSCGRPARQYSHSPQRCDGPPTTSSPGDQVVTSSPTATTRPENSCPPIEFGAPHPSTNIWRSLPHTPQWLTSSRTSSGPSSGTGRSSTTMSRGPR